MKKDGFTLVELLAVIVILAILLLVTTPVVIKHIRDAQSTSNDVIIKNLEDAGVNYALEHVFMSNDCAVDYNVDDSHILTLPNNCKQDINTFKVSVAKLIDGQYFKDDAKKVKTDGDVIIYKYKYVNNEGKTFYDVKAFASEKIFN